VDRRQRRGDAVAGGCQRRVPGGVPQAGRAAVAAAAHKIAADLFEHHTGSAHPDAPVTPESEAK